MFDAFFYLSNKNERKRFVERIKKWICKQRKNKENNISKMCSKREEEINLIVHWHKDFDWQMSKYSKKAFSFIGTKTNLS